MHVTLTKLYNMLVINSSRSEPQINVYHTLISDCWIDVRLMSNSRFVAGWQTGLYQFHAASHQRLHRTVQQWFLWIIVRYRCFSKTASYIRTVPMLGVDWGHIISCIVICNGHYLITMSSQGLNSKLCYLSYWRYSSFVLNPWFLPLQSIER